MGKRVISFSPPDISELEIAEVAEALRSGWITTGQRTKLLERRLAAYIETGRTDIDCTTEEAIAKYSQKIIHCIGFCSDPLRCDCEICGHPERRQSCYPHAGDGL